jgi:ATP-binding cassette subfamily B protein
MIKYENDATKDIYDECFQYIHRHSYRFFTDNLSGSLVRKINKLAGSYENVVDTFIFQILNIIIFIPMTIVIVMRENMKIGFVFLAFVIVYSVLQVIFFNITKKYEIKANEENSKAM